MISKSCKPHKIVWHSKRQTWNKRKKKEKEKRERKRDRKTKTEKKDVKKEKEKRKMRKSQTIVTNTFVLLLFYVESFIFCYITYYILLYLVYIVTFALPLFHVTGYWKCSNKTPTPI